MNTEPKLRQGTLAWFEMVGTLMREAALRSGPRPQLSVSMVERYIDGAELSDGLVQGLRFDIINGLPSFRVGARPDEQADVTMEITAAGARRLNSLYSADPAYAAALDALLKTHELRIDGDPSMLGDWIKTVHDPIVDRTI